MMPLLFQIVGCLMSANIFKHMKPFCYNQDFYEATNLGAFVIIAYSFSTTSWAGTLILEREYKLKYSLNVMGCRPITYWLGTFFFDYLFYLINFCIFVGMLYLFGNKILIK